MTDAEHCEHAGASFSTDMTAISDGGGGAGGRAGEPTTGAAEVALSAASDCTPAASCACLMGTNVYCKVVHVSVLYKQKYTDA